MQDSKLINLLKSLNADEFRRFYKFIRSPYFNYSKDLLKLFDYLRKYYPEFPDHLIEKERIFKLLFPGKAHKDDRIRNLMSKLSQLVEDYLLFLDINQNDFNRRLRLKEIYGRRNLYDLFKRESSRLITEVAEQGCQDSDYYKNLYFLNQALYFHPQTDKQENASLFVNAALINLVHYFAIAQSRLACELKNRNEILSEENHFKDFDFKDLNLESNALFLLLRQMINVLETDDITAYKKLKKEFIQKSPHFRQEDCQYLLSFLINYTIRQTSKQETRFFEETFKLYKFGLEQSLLFHNNQLTDFTFLNIVITGSRLKNFVWTKSFIDDYKDTLDLKSKKDITMLAIAFWHFHKSDYEKARKAIVDHNFSQVLTQINAKTLLLRSYYELYRQGHTYFDLINSKCEAFEKYIRRNRVINKRRKENYLNFVRFIKKLINKKNAFSEKKENKENLLLKLESHENIFARSWLVEKIQSL